MKTPEPKRAARSGYQPYHSYQGRLVDARYPEGQRTVPVRGRHFWLPGLFALLLCAGLFGGGYLAVQHRAAAASAAQARARAIAAANRQQKIASFGAQVNTILQAEPSVTFSVAAIDLATGARQQFGSSESFDAASTGKLLTAAAFFHEVEQGKSSLQQMIDGDTAQDLLQQMIVVSDDAAWLEINDAVGHDGLAAYASSLGITGYDSASNLLTASDVANILQRLYAGKLLSNAHQKLLLGWMQQASYRDFIVPAVPASDAIYHKAGEDEDNVHDAAIITNGKRAMVLVIFTNGNGTYEWAGRAALFRRITTAAINDYLGE